MNEQELRAKTLVIAELNTGGGLFDVRNGIIEFDRKQLDYLKAIEAYIKDKNFREVSRIVERELPGFTS